MKRLSTVLISVFILHSCGFASHRDYLSEMEDEDQGFFEPGTDFPITAGDTGRRHRTKKEWNQRLPASVSELASREQDRNLKAELEELESDQSSEAMEHYLRYKVRLASTSEKIYFLKLRYKREREDYLYSRGLVYSEGARSPVSWALPQHHDDLSVGMSKEDVQEIFGRPERIDVAGNPTYQNERWVYRRDGAVKHVFFESGRVGGWSSAK